MGSIAARFQVSTTKNGLEKSNLVWRPVIVKQGHVTGHISSTIIIHMFN